MANGKNPIPIIVPCHRVIGKDGSLTGFGGGLDVKKQLLQLEKIWACCVLWAFCKNAVSRAIECRSIAINKSKEPWVRGGSNQHIFKTFYKSLVRNSPSALRCRNPDSILRILFPSLDPIWDRQCKHLSPRFTGRISSFCHPAWVVLF